MDEGLKTLLARLEAASETYRNGELRRGSTMSLEAVLDYLRDLDLPEENRVRVRAPLLGLLAALDDADRGLRDPHTAPGEHPGGRPTPLKDGHDMAAKAAAVNLLRLTGMKMKDALKRVADTRDEQRQIKDLRHNISRNLASPEATAFYSFILSAAKDFDFPPENAAEAVLQFVKDVTAKKP